MSMRLEDFFRNYAEFEPEEVASLGLEGHDERLRDMSPEADEGRAALWRNAREACRQPRRIETPSARLDRLTLLRHARFECLAHEQGIQAANPQWATYPYSMTRYLASRRRASPAEILDREGPYRRRAARIPDFLAAHRRALEAALARGQVAHRAFLSDLREHELPAARAFFARLDEKAALAYDRHAAFIAEELLPRAPVTAILGAEDYAHRLALTHGISRPLDELVAEARESLRVTQAEMKAVARKLEGGASIDDLAGVHALMLELQKEKLQKGCDLRAHYRGIIDRVMRRLAEAGEYTAFDADEIGMDDYPEGMRDMGPGTNWPAPVLDEKAAGQFVLHPDPGAHSRAWSAVLAVHEGAPGHFLQSRGFQRAFKAARAPLRFIAVADDVAIPRLNFGAMLNIEGYAVYAEKRARLAGCHQGADLLFALAAEALRAVRVIAEIELHREAMTPEEVESFVCLNAGLPSAYWELQRYQRAPLQAVAYHFGARAFEELRDAVAKRRGAAFAAAAFHDELFAEGPALPADIADEMLEEG